MVNSCVYYFCNYHTRYDQVVFPIFLTITQGMINMHLCFVKMSRVLDSITLITSEIVTFLTLLIKNNTCVILCYNWHLSGAAGCFSVP